MCNSPNKLADGSLVACRKCSQCRSNRIDEWVGRCIAESKTSVATTFITLTYGRDVDGNESHSRAAILTYSDVQKYFKQLRKRGFPCRYLMVGELGSKKGRAHWHGLVFWQKDIPTSQRDYGNNAWSDWKTAEPVYRLIEWDKRFYDPCWPHGFSHWTPVRNGNEKGSIVYACKYINKDVDDVSAQSKLAMSKRPPIGADYFVNRAQKFVDAGIAPQDPFYQFPGEAKRKNGNVVNFMLRGKVLEIFVQAFLDKWKAEGRGHPPASKFLEDVQDAMLRKETGEYTYVGRIAEEKRHVWIPNPETQGGIGPWLNVPVPETEGPTFKAALAAIYSRPFSELTQSQRVERLTSQCVFWITSSTNHRGRYRIAKQQPATGSRVWLRSTMQTYKSGVPR